jgi:hypothetical protein
LRKDAALKWEIQQIEQTGPNWREHIEAAEQAAGASPEGASPLGGGGGGGAAIPDFGGGAETPPAGGEANGVVGAETPALGGEENGVVEAETATPAA